MQKQAVDCTFPILPCVIIRFAEDGPLRRWYKKTGESYIWRYLSYEQKVKGRNVNVPQLFPDLVQEIHVTTLCLPIDPWHPRVANGVVLDAMSNEKRST